MDDYPPRVTKSENMFKLWETGEGDMGELAIGLYDLTAHYKALWDDYTQLEAELAKWRTKYSKNMCAECTLYGLECECDDTLNGGG